MEEGVRERSGGTAGVEHVRFAGMPLGGNERGVLPLAFFLEGASFKQKFLVEEVIKYTTQKP